MAIYMPKFIAHCTRSSAVRLWINEQTYKNPTHIPLSFISTIFFDIHLLVVCTIKLDCVLDGVTAASTAAVWSLSGNDMMDDDLDIMDSDELLDDEDLKKPDPASLKGNKGVPRMQDSDFIVTVVGKDFHAKRLCLVCKIFN